MMFRPIAVLCSLASRTNFRFRRPFTSQWWKREGRQRYPESQCLLILADAGGSNSAAWGLAVEGVHFARHNAVISNTW